MTGWSEIISNSAMVLIDDVRMQDQLALSPALFYRRMSLYIKLALPLLSSPPELLSHLQSEMTQPVYDDFEWTSNDESIVNETVVKTGKTGYELCSVIVKAGNSINESETADAGEITGVPYAEAVYDPETGDITFPKQSSAGITYLISFYTDGTFPTLTPAMMRLFGLAAALVWDERFSRNWLNMQMKIKDPSFNIGNEAEYIAAVTERLAANRRMFDEELKKYEQNTIYANTPENAGKIKNFI